MADWPFRTAAWTSTRRPPLAPGRAPVPVLTPEPAFLKAAGHPVRP
jgi:hypothetical protein